MVRTLLADRFKLVTSNATRPLPAFVLSTGKTLRLKQAAATAEPGNCDYQPPPKDVPPATTMNIRFSCHNVTMQAFADFLRDVASLLSQPARRRPDRPQGRMGLRHRMDLSNPQRRRRRHHLRGCRQAARAQARAEDRADSSRPRRKRQPDTHAQHRRPGQDPAAGTALHSSMSPSSAPSIQPKNISPSTSTPAAGSPSSTPRCSLSSTVPTTLTPTT